jgi:hypothetical protein
MIQRVKLHRLGSDTPVILEYENLDVMFFDLRSKAETFSSIEIDFHVSSKDELAGAETVLMGLSHLLDD